MFNNKNISIKKFPQSCFLIESANSLVNESEGKSDYFYIDPFKIPDGHPKADIVFITHEHYDHCDIDSLKKIIKEDTIIVGNQLVADKIKTEINFEHFILVEPCSSGTIKNIKFTCTEAYTTTKKNEEGRIYHPQENFGVGYILDFNPTDLEDKVRIYHMGDTDFIPEHRDIKNVDILLIPVSGTYVMTPIEAAMAANNIKPDVAIPMHYDASIGSIKDAEDFVKLCEGEVQILEAIV